MKPDLSIIIPCYNCEKTVGETVDSCYKQGLGDSFEIIMVDDGSTDNTCTVIKNIAEKYKNVRYIFHEKNLGGGAARNTAVDNAAADVIFCIDSDDSLPDDTLDRMYSRLIEKKCDGMTFSGAYSFSKKKENHRLTDFGLDTEKPITLDSLFSGKPWMVGEYFMYTKESFYTAGGYPTDHSFDTQGFGFKYNARGLKAYVCPKTFMYKRQFGDQISYFERAYNSGEFSVNYYLILLEHIEIFSPKIKEMILNYDIFAKNTLQNNIIADLQKEYRKDKVCFFSGTKENTLGHSPESEYQKNNFKTALSLFISSYRNYRNMYFDGMRYLYGASNNSKMTIDNYKHLIKENSITPHGHDSLRPTLLARAKRKIKKYLPKQ